MLHPLLKMHVKSSHTASFTGYGKGTLIHYCLSRPRTTEVVPSLIVDDVSPVCLGRDDFREIFVIAAF